MLAAIRELLGAGTLFGFKVMPDSFEPAIIFILPSGAFLTLGFLIAAANFIAEKRSQRAAKAVAADNDGIDNESTDNAGIDNANTDNAGIDNENIGNESGEEGDKQ